MNDRTPQWRVPVVHAAVTLALLTAMVVVAAAPGGRTADDVSAAAPAVRMDVTVDRTTTRIRTVGVAGRGLPDAATVVAPDGSDAGGPAQLARPLGQPSRAGALAAPCDVACRGQRILDRMRLPLPVGWQVRFEGERPGFLGMADPGERLVEIFLRPSQSDDHALHVLHHEYGHAYDFAWLDDRDRATWAAERGYPADPWYPTCEECDDRDSPAGDWAESFAYCHTGQARRFRSELAPLPSDGQCALLLELAASTDR